MSIETRCLVVNLTIAMWSGQRLDKQASTRVTAEAHASADAARVNKHLVPKEALKDIVAAHSALRQHFYAATLPWRDNGDRLLPAAKYLDFVTEHRKLRQAFDAAVSDFAATRYPEAMQRAQFRMGALFNRDDYPDASVVARRFGVSLSVLPVATGDDFRVAMNDEDIEQLRAEVGADLTDRVRGAVQALKERLAATLGHFVEKLSGDAIWRNTTLTNLQDLVETLPDLNVTDDPDIDAAYRSLKATVMGWDADTLRRRANDKASVASDARAALDALLRGMTQGGTDDADDE